ncbi:MAG: lipoprotein signal peptidase [Bacteroidales bacterium]|jgi:signal peptidase II|nr:lipoprotein signal peptidase [Bacteroidales bacterium]HOI31872.1 lipoprotein signal peptidase [Bacteroidales bacterium]
MLHVKKHSTLKKPLLIVFLVLLLDQALKFYIKLNMTIGQEILITDWFIIHFTENNGMAFGFEFAGEWGKLALSIFRILAVIAIFIYLVILSRKKTRAGAIFGLSMIMAGALGNIIDSAFYGLIFSASSYHTVATLLPEAGGYASFLHGKVVDMFYFPLLILNQAEAPAWIPDFIFGNDGYFIFFRPVFNIADAAITTGVLWLLLFERNFLKGH